MVPVSWHIGVWVFSASSMLSRMALSCVFPVGLVSCWWAFWRASLMSFGSCVTASRSRLIAVFSIVCSWFMSVPLLVWGA